MKLGPVVWMVLAVGCSKSSTEKTEAPPPPKPAVAIDAAAEPAEAATVVGPTRNATGKVELDGAIKGTFEWKKKDQRSPITCMWDSEKDIGTLRVDLSDGSGKLVSLGVEFPPAEVGMPYIDVSSKDLASSLKSSLGFNTSDQSTDDAMVIVVKLDSKLGDDEKKPDLTIKGELTVTCPRKKK